MSDEYEGFCRGLFEALDMAVPDRHGPATLLVEDLGFDSFRHLEVLANLERDHDAVPADPPTLRTLGDAHAYHRALCGLAAAQMDD